MVVTKVALNGSKSSVKKLMTNNPFNLGHFLNEASYTYLLFWNMLYFTLSPHLNYKIQQKKGKATSGRIAFCSIHRKKPEAIASGLFDFANYSIIVTNQIRDRSFGIKER